MHQALGVVSSTMGPQNVVFHLIRNLAPPLVVTWGDCVHQLAVALTLAGILHQATEGANSLVISHAAFLTIVAENRPSTVAIRVLCTRQHATKTGC